MTITETSTTAEVLRAALDFMRRPIGRRPNRWTQRDYGKVKGCVCTVGAVRAVVTGSTALPIGWGSQVDQAVLTLAAASGIEFPDQSGVIQWNDVPGRTFAEVEAIFEKAIENAEAAA